MADPSKRSLQQDRFAEVKRMYPSIENLDWEKAFQQDPALMGAIIHDILKADAAEGSTGGRRPHLGPEVASGPRLRQLMGEDHSLLPFPNAFGLLVGEMRLSTVALKVGMSKTQVWRLLRGKVPPTAEDMEKIAYAFRRHPSFFAEWRATWVLGLLARRLERLPEATIGYYRRLSMKPPSS